MQASQKASQPPTKPVCPVIKTDRPRQKSGSGRRSPAITDHPGSPLGGAQLVEQQKIAIGIHALPKAAMMVSTKLIFAGQCRQHVVFKRQISRSICLIEY